VYGGVIVNQMEPANTITHDPWWQLDTLTSGPYFPDSTNIPATGN